MQNSFYYLKTQLKGFTLAEMMAVLLILSLSLAAFMPIVTIQTKSTTTSEDLWNYVADDANKIYYGTGNTPGVAIGIDTFEDTDDARLLIDKGDSSLPFISLGRTVYTGGAYRDYDESFIDISSSGNIRINSPYTVVDATATNGVILLGDSLYGADNVVVGHRASGGTTAGSSSNVAVGYQSYTRDTEATAVGNSARSYARTVSINAYNASGEVENSVKIGSGAWAYGHYPTSVGARSYLGSPTLPNPYYQVALGYYINPRGDYSTFATTASALTSYAPAYAVNIDGAQYIPKYSVNIGKGGSFGSSTAGQEENAAYGVSVGYTNTTKATAGGEQVSIGCNVQNHGAQSIAIGNGAGLTDTTEYTKTTAIGSRCDCKGNNSVAVGFESAPRENSIAIGSLANSTITTGTDAVVIGAGANSNSNYGIAIGKLAKITGASGVAIGSSDTSYATEAAENGVAIGRNAKALESGVAVGVNASGNTSLGYNAQSPGVNSVAIGYNAKTTGDYSTTVGAKSEAGTHSVAVGYETTANGLEATAVGPGAIASGNYSTAIGIGAVASGEKSIAIGNNVTVAHSNSIGIGGNTVGNNTVKLGTSTMVTMCYNNLYLDGSTPVLSSDRKLKNVGEEFTDGLDKINKIRVYNYTMKNDKKNKLHTGVVAQELKKIFPDSVIKGKDGYLSIKNEEMFCAMINSIKELDRKIQLIATQIKTVYINIIKLEEKLLTTLKESQKISADIKTLESRKAKLEQRNKNLNIRLKKLEEIAQK